MAQIRSYLMPSVYTRSTRATEGVLIMRITKRFVDTVSTPDLNPSGAKTQKFYRDDQVPGFALRITSGGVKSFIVEKRINGKVKRKTLGRYGNLTVEQARLEAMKFTSEIATGKDPIAEKKAKEAKSVTLQQAFDDYLLARKNLSETTIKDYKRAIDTGFSDWKSKALLDITKDMVEARHRLLGKSSHARANNSMRVLRAVINHAKSKYEDAQGKPVILFNPVDRISDTSAWYKVELIRTLIKPHQLADWYQATLKLNAETTRDFFHLILFTGLRRSEASRLKWADVDFKDKTLTITETKNHEIHTLPLSDFLENLLKRRSEIKTNEYVFPSTSKLGFLKEPKTAVQKVSEISGVGFSLHDLRRTFITIAESLDIPGYALKRLLNHKDPNDVTAGYIVSDVNRLRDPMQRITNFIYKNISGEK